MGPFKDIFNSGNMRNLCALYWRQYCYEKSICLARDFFSLMQCHEFQSVKFMLVTEEEIYKGLFFDVRNICFDSSAFFSLGDSAFPLWLMKYCFWTILKSQ